jgi:hypothetical protein
MPANKNIQGGVEEKAPAKTIPPAKESVHVKLEETRRGLEAELATIDMDLRAAIHTGDMVAIDKLDARKRELPRLYIAASTAEKKAAQDAFNAQDQVSLKELRSAEDERDAIQAKLIRRKKEHEAEIADLTEQLDAANAAVGVVYSDIQASRNHAASCDAGFKRAMAAITGV